MFDQNKRNTLKAVSVAGIGAGAIAAVPGALAAASHVLGTDNQVANVPFSGVTVTHYENFQGHTVLLRNKTDRPVTVLKLSPGNIQTLDGDVNLDPLFESGDMTLAANSTQAVSITHAGKATRYATWTHIDRPTSVAQTGVDTQLVSVVGQHGDTGGISSSHVVTAWMSVS